LKPRILVVDDEPTIRALLKTTFLRAGYQVELADNVAAAKAACMQQSFDAVLSDVTMPDGNGHELMRWMAVNRPSTASLLMTGFDSGCERCPHSPRCTVITKPFKPDHLVAVLAKVVKCPASDCYHDRVTADAPAPPA
jgi:DNA-binding NtrC family response regulator